MKWGPSGPHFFMADLENLGDRVRAFGLFRPKTQIQTQF
jgi:hypothetical protein